MYEKYWIKLSYNGAPVLVNLQHAQAFVKDQMYDNPPRTCVLIHDTETIVTVDETTEEIWKLIK